MSFLPSKFTIESLDLTFESQHNPYRQLRLDIKQIRDFISGFWVSIGVVYANGGKSTLDGLTAHMERC
jgi:hypothetical protein